MPTSGARNVMRPIFHGLRLASTLRDFSGVISDSGSVSGDMPRYQGLCGSAILGHAITMLAQGTVDLDILRNQPLVVLCVASRLQMRRDREINLLAVRRMLEP
jgi:hypothetical protein